MSLGKQIIKRRKQLGLSQTQLANKLDVSKKTITYYEKDKLVPEYEKLEELSQVLKCSVNELLEIENSDETNNQAVLIAFIKQISSNQVKLYHSYKNIVMIGCILFTILCITTLGCIFVVLKNTQSPQTMMPIYEPIEESSYIDFSWICKERTDVSYQMQLEVNLKKYFNDTKLIGLLSIDNHSSIEIPLEKVEGGQYISNIGEYDLYQKPYTLKLRIQNQDEIIEEVLMQDETILSYVIEGSVDLSTATNSRNVQWTINPMPQGNIIYESQPTSLWIEPCINNQVEEGFELSFKKEGENYVSDWMALSSLMEDTNEIYFLMSIEEENGFVSYYITNTFNKGV